MRATTITTTTSTSQVGRLRLGVELRHGRSAVVRAAGHVPYAARVVPAGRGWARILLVQTVAGPLAGDRTVIDVELGAGAALELVTNAATLAYPADTPARYELEVTAGTGSRFAWMPAPLILAAGCDLEASVGISLAGGAAAYVRETVVLGRHGESPGRYRSRLRCEQEDRPLVHEGVEIDERGITASSAAILAGARAFASLGLLGIRPGTPAGPGELELSGPGRVMRALGAGAAALLEKTRPVDAAYRAALEV